MEQTKPSWKKRHRIIVATLIFCAINISYIVWRGNESEVHEVAIVMLIGLAGSVIGSYVFGAVWDDKNHKL